MVNVFSHFSLPQISAVARRTALAALVVGVGALAILVLLGYPLVGLGVCLGMAMALANFRLIAASTVKASASENADKRRPLVMNTLGRLGVISIIALGLTLLQRQLGFASVVRPIDRISGAPHRLRDGLADHLVVFHQQQTHRATSPE